MRPRSHKAAMVRTSQTITAAYIRRADSDGWGIRGLSVKSACQPRLRESFPPSGDWRPEPVVHPVDRPRARRTAVADNEIGIGHDIAAVAVNHAGLANERFAVAQRELDTVVARLHLESETADGVSGHALAFEGRQVHELDGAAVDKSRSFGAADAAADDHAGLRRWIRFEDRG